MRKINLENYMETVRNESGDDVELPYDVRNSMIEVLLSRDLGLSAREALDRHTLACRIRDCSNGAILLEEADYTKLVAAIDTIKGWCRTDIEFLHRITEA
ncbi:unnamed protein product, partial [marine sediment metagenome]